MKNDFNLCPMCGSKKIENHNNRKWICPDCGFDLYCNVAAAVGIIIIDKFNNVLFEVRAKEPRKGYVALPGGFVDGDESGEEGIIRECKEEMGFTIKNPKYVCSYPNTYCYKNIEYKTCDMFFCINLPDNFESINDLIKSLEPETKEVVKFVSYKVEKIEDVDTIPLAFESAKNTLLTFIRGR